MGLGGVLGLAVALSYVLYFAPQQKAKAARAEVETWGLHWQATKDCILGSPLKSSEPTQALAIREIQERDVTVKLRKCVSHLKKLRREPGASSDNDRLEKAWYELQRPVAEVGKAHAWRTATEPNDTLRALRRKLAKTIAPVNKAYNTLRVVSGLAAESPTGQALPNMQLTAVLEGPSGPVSVSDLAVGNGRLDYLSHGPDGALWRSTLSDSGATHAALSPLAVRAMSGSWGLWLEKDGIPILPIHASPGTTLMSGPLDEFGEPGGDGSPIRKLKDAQSITPLFAIGEQSRLAVFRFTKRENNVYSFAYQLVSSTDAGAHWTQQTLPTGDIWVELKARPQGNSISWNDESGLRLLRWQQLTPDGIKELLLDFADAPTGDWPPEVCEAPERAWWILNGALYFVSEEGRLQSVPGRLQMGHDEYMRCTNESFSISRTRYTRDRRVVLRHQSCSREGCESEPREVPLGESGTYQLIFHEGEWLAVTVLDEVVAVWRGKSSTASSLASMTARGEIVGALSYQGRLQLVLWPEDEDAPSLMAFP